MGELGRGHLVVSCQAPGCESLWYKPAPEKATATPHRYPGRG